MPGSSNITSLLFLFCRAHRLALLLLVVIFSSFSGNLKARERAEGAFFDSLTKQVNHAVTDTAKLHLWLLLARKYPLFDPNKGKQAGLAAAEMARRYDRVRDEAFAYLYTGINEISAARSDSANHYLVKARTIAEEYGYRDIRGYAMRQIGIAFYNNNSYPSALQAFFDALTYQEQEKNDTEIYVNLEYIGHIYEAEKAYDKALVYYQKSFETASRVGEKTAVARNELNIGQVHQLTGKWQLAVDCYNKALSIFNERNDESGIAFVAANLAVVYNELGRYTDALSGAEKARDIYTHYSDMYNLSAVYANFAKIYLTIIQHPNVADLPDSLHNKARLLQLSFQNMDKSITICKSLNNMEGLYGVYEGQALAYELGGNFQEALSYYKKFIRLRDSVFSNEQKLQIADIESTREIAQKDGELKLKQLDLQKRRNENILLSLGLALLFLVVILLYRKGKTQKRLNDTISNLVAAQEKTIEERTAALKTSNKKLLELVEFNTHIVREPATRIMSLYMLKKEVSTEEFETVISPMIEEAVMDLDESLRTLVKTAEQP